MTYVFTVTHALDSDNSPISNVTILDDVAGIPTLVSGDTGNDGILESGETWVYTASYTLSLADPDPLTNEVTVSGEDLDGETVGPVTDQHSLSIEYNPTLAVTKTGPSSAQIGETVTYVFTVTHGLDSDNSPISNTTILDDLAGIPTLVSGDTNLNNELDGGETWVYTASHTLSLADPDPLTNEVTVSGEDLDGETVGPVTDQHSLNIEYEPMLAVTKTGPSSGTLGETVTYIFTVTHALDSDNSPISNITILDDVAGTPTLVSGDTGSDGLLEGGETWVYTARPTLSLSDPDPLTNEVTVSGEDLDGETVGPVTDQHSLNIEYEPTLAVTKTGPSSGTLGETVTYVFTVTHALDSDNSPISNITILET